MLKHAPTLAIVAVHTDENEPSRVQVRNTKITLTRNFRRSVPDAAGDGALRAMPDTRAAYRDSLRVWDYLRVPG